MKAPKAIEQLQHLIWTRIERDICWPIPVITCWSPVWRCKLLNRWTLGARFFFFGNGGSAANAQHLAAEFTGRYLKERRALPVLALHTNISSLTAIGNDYGFDFIFARQLEALGKAGDVAVGISTGGNSRNVLRALEAAKAKSIYTVALTGGSGGAIKNLADCAICIPSEETPRIQECHILTGHLIREIVEELFESHET